MSNQSITKLAIVDFYPKGSVESSSAVVKVRLPLVVLSGTASAIIVSTISLNVIEDQKLTPLQKPEHRRDRGQLGTLTFDACTNNPGDALSQVWGNSPPKMALALYY